jgi:hypothetical protein
MQEESYTCSQHPVAFCWYRAPRTSKSFDYSPSRAFSLVLSQGFDLRGLALPIQQARGSTFPWRMIVAESVVPLDPSMSQGMLVAAVAPHEPCDRRRRVPRTMRLD